jgi:hypothetical protein
VKQPAVKIDLLPTYGITSGVDDWQWDPSAMPIPTMTLLDMDVDKIGFGQERAVIHHPQVAMVTIMYLFPASIQVQHLLHDRW